MPADRQLIVRFNSDDQPKPASSFTSDRLIVWIIRNEGLTVATAPKWPKRFPGDVVAFLTIRRSADHSRTVTAGCPDRQLPFGDDQPGGGR